MQEAAAEHSHLGEEGWDCSGKPDFIFSPQHNQLCPEFSPGFCSLRKKNAIFAPLFNHTTLHFNPTGEELLYVSIQNIELSLFFFHQMALKTYTKAWNTQKATVSPSYSAEAGARSGGHQIPVKLPYIAEHTT